VVKEEKSGLGGKKVKGQISRLKKDRKKNHAGRKGERKDGAIPPREKTSGTALRGLVFCLKVGGSTKKGGVKKKDNEKFANHRKKRCPKGVKEEP